MYGYKYASLLFLISEADCCTKNKKTSGYVNNMILIFAYSDVPRKQIVDIADSLGGSIVGEIPEIYQYQIQVGFTECIIVNASYFYISCVQRSWTTLAGESPVTVIASEPCS